MVEPSDWQRIAADAVRSMGYVPRSHVDDCVGAALVTYSRIAARGREIHGGAYARTIAQAAAVDHLRSVWGRTGRKAEMHAVSLDRGEHGASDDNTERTELLAMIAALPDRRHRLILTARMCGYTLAEIADMVGVTQSRVSQIVSALVLKLSGDSD